MSQLPSSYFARGVLVTLPVLPLPPPAAAALPLALPLAVSARIYLPPTPVRVHSSLLSLTFEDAALEDAYLAWVWARQATPVRLAAALLAAAFVAIAALATAMISSKLVSVVNVLLWTGAGLGLGLAGWAWLTTLASPFRVSIWSAIAASVLTIDAALILIAFWVCRILVSADSNSSCQASLGSTTAPLAITDVIAVAAPLFERSLLAVSATHTIVSGAVLLALIVVTLVVGRNWGEPGVTLSSTLLIAFSALAYASTAVSSVFGEAADRLVFISHLTLQRVALAAGSGATTIACEVAAHLEADGDLAFAAEAAAAADMPRGLVVVSASDGAARRRWQGWPAAAALGPSFFEGVCPESADELVASFARAMGELAEGAAAASEEVSIKARFKRRLLGAAAGEWMCLRAYVRRASSGGFRIVGYEEATDKQVLEDRRRAHEFAGRASVAAGVVATNEALAWAAHELRAPAHNISTLMDLLQRRPGLPADAQQDLEAIAVAASDLRDLTTDLLEANTARAADSRIIVHVSEGVDLRLLLAQ